MICTRMDWWLRKENDQVNLMPIMAGRYVLSSIMNSIIKDAFAEGKYVKNVPGSNLDKINILISSSRDHHKKFKIEKNRKGKTT